MGYYALLVVSPVRSDGVAHERVHKNSDTSHLDKMRSQEHFQKVKFWSLDLTQNQ
ncbi:Archaeal flavoprotein [Pseudomonas syringae pv. actinidiae]|uniref:Archaeal flavoprotein n=1 Tax=Pseudomonas syringae pv. actinidiae TaxID=103796 RepID=A0A2V0QWI0_PSESF|nr:Archaeal flavoprotein [Pseudomonas syringae pv. actinidiae]